MRRTLVAGNWKMNLDRQGAVSLASALRDSAPPDNVDVAICPPYVYLDAVHQAVRGSHVGLGAQDVYFESTGAFTGEISCAMLADVGCQYVILGHSERRNVIGETDHLINRKVKSALAAGLIPIVCVGELLQQREAGQTLPVVTQQFDGSLSEISADQMQHLVLAYEPVWAIGTGKTATPQQAQEVHADLRKLMAQRYNQSVSDQVQILYGGSVKPANAADLMSQPDIDGALVGGASLESESFSGIVAAGGSRATV